MQQTRSVMNITLWILQILWGIFFSFTGFGKILCIDQAVWHQMLPNVAWFSAEFVRFHRRCRIPGRRRRDSAGDDWSETEAHRLCCSRADAGNDFRCHISYLARRVPLLCADQSGDRCGQRVHCVWTAVCEAIVSLADEHFPGGVVRAGHGRLCSGVVPDDAYSLKIQIALSTKNRLHN